MSSATFNHHHPSTHLYFVDSPPSPYNHARQDREQQQQQRPWPVLLAPQKKSNLFRLEDRPFQPASPPPPDVADSSKVSPTFLSVAVKNLSASLKTYSDILEEPTLDNAAQACRALDASMPSNSSLGRPESPASQQQQAISKINFHPDARASSPLYWPLDVSRSSLASTAASAAAVGDSWETLVSPFFFLAGAEVLSSNLEHVASPLKSGIAPLASLTGLYQLAQLQLKRTQEAIRFESSSFTVPLSPSSHDGLNEESERNGVKEASALISDAIDALLEAISTRCQLIELQSLLFRRRNSSSGKSSKELTQAANAASVLLEAFLAAIPRGVDGYGPVKGILSNMLRECFAWKFCFESCAFLDRCDFAHTLLSLRQWKSYLPQRNVNNRVTQWMYGAMGKIKSLLPIYFDRVRAFASPLYGFDTTNLWLRRVSHQTEEDNSAVHWEAVIHEFMRRHAKSGGSASMAVALVLDAASIDSYHVERGYQTTKNYGDSDELGELVPSKDETKTALERWPAVYLRSSARIGNVSAVLPSPHSSSVWSSQSSLKRSTGHLGTNSPPVTSRRKLSLRSSSPLIATLKSSTTSLTTKPNQAILEYAPDSGDAHTFPHNLWDFLANNLLETKQTSLAGAPRKRTLEQQHATRSYYFEDQAMNHPPHPSSTPSQDTSPLFSFHWSDSRRQGSFHPHRRRQQQQNAYHVATVGEWLRVVVIVAGPLDEAKRQNRSDDIQSFVSDLAQGLCVRGLICKEAVADYTPKSKIGPLKLPLEDLSSPERELRAQYYLSELREAFGLRPSSPFFSERSLYSPRLFGPPSPISRRRQQHQEDVMTQSAAALFLGAELASSTEWVLLSS